MTALSQTHEEYHRTSCSPTPRIDATTVNLSFAGCGFLCFYHAGVCAAIKEYAPQLMRNKMYGASAGSIVAAGLICNVDMVESIQIMLGTVSRANSSPLQTLSPNFDLIGIVRDGLNRMLPHNAHELCTGRLFISLTRYRDFRNMVVSEFETRDELIQAILCSSFIPFYCGWQPPLYRGEAYCDGGLSDNQPIYDRNTITVSPFSGESDICPSDLDSASIIGVDFCNTSIRVTAQNLFRLFSTLFPPSLDICSRMCSQGFADALVLLNKKGLVPCVRCLAQQDNPLTLTPPPERIPRVRNQSYLSNKSRRRLDTECETCYDNVADTSHRPSTDSLFPPIIQKAIDDAKAAENKFFGWLYSYRVFRWGRRFVAPAFFPFECAIFTVRTIQNWIFSASTAEFFLHRLYITLDFILAEIAKNNLLYSSRISAQLKPLFDQRKFITTSQMKQQTADVHLLPPEVVGELQVPAEDSVQRLVEFSKSRDNTLFHFYSNFHNSNFQSSNPGTALSTNNRKSRSFRSAKRTPNAARMKFSQSIGMLREQDSFDEHDEDSLSPVSNRAEDSGLSLTEDSSAGNVTKRRRDTCCSPVNLPAAANKPPLRRESSNSLQISGICDSALNDPSSSRRHTISDSGRGESLASSTASKPTPLVRTPKQSVVGPVSSDSEADNAEKFFVPTRRKRTNSNAYDGEPEQSDTDHDA